MELTSTAERRSTRSVTFTGAGERTGAMTWGQASIYSSIRWLGDDASYFNLVRVVDVPAGVDEGTVLGAVQHLLVRHEGLRSLFHETPEGWTQHVRPQGELTVHVADADGAADTAAARAFASELAGHTFRHDVELPLSVGVLRDHGRVTHVVVAASHLAVDGWAADLVAQDLRRLLAGEVADAPTWQPLDQAAHEAGEAGAARGEAALAYWRRTLAAAPRPLFPPADPAPAPGRFVRLALESRALAVAATLVSTRCAVSTGTVLLAAASVVLGRLVGQDRVVLQLIASNRLDERSRSLVAPLAENALFAIDVSGADAPGGFATTARRAFASGLNAYRHAQYDPRARDELVAQERARDADLDLGCFFNDMRIGRDWGVDVDAYPDVDAVRALRDGARVRHVGSWDRQDATCFVGVDDADGACVLYLMADTALVPEPRVEALLREMESVVVEAVAP